MRITVELSDSDVKEIPCLTGEKNKGPAIRRLMADALMLKRRKKWPRNSLIRNGVSS